jgi:calcium-dependent protein kinase
VVYLHTKGVALNQLNPSSILHITPTLSSAIKLTEFDMLGGQDAVPHDLEKYLGDNKVLNACYAAPEVLYGKWSLKNDEWAVGVLLYQLLTGTLPFHSDNYKEVVKQVQNYKFDQTSERWSSLSLDARDLLLKLLSFRHEDRLSAEEALTHVWLRKAQRGELDQIALPEALSALKAFHTGSRLKLAIQQFLLGNLLSHGELTSLAEQFRLFDKNKNGRLSREELINGFREIRGIDFSEKEIDELIKRVDLDGSGDIDYNEFMLGAVSAERLLSEDRLEKAF